MKEKDQNKWESWASKMHCESLQSDQGNFSDDEVDADFKVAQQIYRLRAIVSRVRKLKTSGDAWSEFERMNIREKRWVGWMKYAAVFIISLLITGSAFWGFQSRQFSEDIYASISAPNGQISNVTLFDGTNVWLNAGSSLKYKQSFNKNNREVILEGEALFSVTKNKELPFIVHTSDAQIKVYGTQFNVKAYQRDSRIETVLIEGEVEFISKDNSVIMKPGEQLLFSKKTEKISMHHVNADECTSWKGGKIYFNNESLLNLTNQLERWYEVKFTFSDEEIKVYRFSGVINKDRSLEYTLNIIQEINKVKFEINKEQIGVKRR